MKSCVEELLALLLRPVKIYLATEHVEPVLRALSRYDCDIIQGDGKLAGADLLVVDAGHPSVTALVKDAAKCSIPALVLMGAYDIDSVRSLSLVSVVGVLGHPVTTDDFEQLFKVLKIRAREKGTAPEQGQPACELVAQLS